MSVEMFFRMEGVEGGTLNYSHKGWADCLSYQWDLAPRAGDALGEGVNQLSLVKTVGPDSAVLMTLCTAATIVRVAELSIIPNLGKRDVPQKYLALTLEDVQVMRISTGGGSRKACFGKPSPCVLARFDTNTINTVTSGQRGPPDPSPPTPLTGLCRQDP